MEKVIDIVNIVINFLKSMGPIGGFLLVLLESIIPALPLSVFITFNIMAYGTIYGIILSYMATVCGCVLSFYLFRYVIKDKFLKGKRKEKTNKLMNKISNIDFNLLVLIVAMPFAPAFLINIAAGLSDIKFKKYFVGLIIGKIAMIYFWGYIGKNFIESLKDPIIIVKILVIMLVAYVLSKIIEKIIKVEE